MAKKTKNSPLSVRRGKVLQLEGQAIQTPGVVVSFMGRPFNHDGSWTPTNYHEAVASGSGYYVNSGESA